LAYEYSIVCNWRSGELMVAVSLFEIMLYDEVIVYKNAERVYHNE
jgi:hypothetical protein